jgi:hypothetical protein
VRIVDGLVARRRRDVPEPKGERQGEDQADQPDDPRVPKAVATHTLTSR